MAFQIMTEQDSIRVTDPATGYVLCLSPEQADSYHAVHFEAPYVGDRPLSITARDIKDYSDPILEHRVDPTAQYAEVGSGLGAFIPHLLTQLSPDSPRPIVIDLANYALMRQMIAYALEEGVAPELDERLETLTGRLDVLTDPTKVTLYNMPLGSAIRTTPTLRGSADVVVDHWGPCRYGRTEFDGANSEQTLGYKVRKLEKKLLRDGGKILS